MHKKELANEMNQYLTFLLAKEVFALDISQVREVLELKAITSIPCMPGFMRGVINLRGNAVPVMDMRNKLGMATGEKTVDTCIIIVEIPCVEGGITMGVMVDSVREVFEMTSDSIEPAPNMGASLKADYIQGMGRQDDQFLIIIDISKIFSPEELSMVAGSPNSMSKRALGGEPFAA
ncbi:chemotaxis protein CheW [Pseudodesulfovibrio sp. zrk46]|uniref:chemotaxis protein CheW n=1 Tax=Pseudodesulfovibrio sp. zrk46 TaxID=2725288 RepID=UPI001449C4AC|nr:chemotaxis protein CheW [Pseudodesulfovibrio sp. zrk46]QJB57514.1 chemotaxis protein CheW [Pseudodesulfovibrio sp. zrk46]